VAAAAAVKGYVKKIKKCITVIELKAVFRPHLFVLDSSQKIFIAYSGLVAFAC